MRRRHLFGFGGIVLSLTLAHAAALDSARLVFLVRYVGSDYARAVRDGEVVNAFEYDEVLRFTREVLVAYQAFPSRADHVVAGLQDLERRIVAHAAGDDVLATARALITPLATSLGVPIDVPAAIDLTRGAALWAADCATCHGETGAGDGPAAHTLDPPPARLRGERLAHLTIEQVYGAVTFGITGTAMASFRDAYTDQQRWDVAGYVMSLDDDPSLKVALQLQEAFARVAERVQASVVGVTAFVADPAWTPSKLTTTKGEAWVVANGEALRHPGYRAVRSGSGFLVSADGYVLSANHQVRDAHGAVAPLVDIELHDGRHLTARVAGTEPTIDLAVLQVIEPIPPGERAITTVTLGNSATVAVGHWVIALGDPPGPDVTYVVGTLSARSARQCYQEDLSRTLIQTSMAVPLASLGGPLVDIRGRVIGVNVQPPGVMLDAPGTARPGYALPIDLALNIYEALKVAESNRSPWLGISVLELPAARQRLGPQARARAFPRTGVYIDDVFVPSPASRAGIQPGDVLVAMGGQRVLSVGEFQTALYLGGIGHDIEVELSRDNRTLTPRLRIEARPPEATTR